MGKVIQEVFESGSGIYVTLNTMFKKNYLLANSDEYELASYGEKRVWLISEEDRAVYIWDVKKLKRFAKIQKLKRTKINEDHLELELRKYGQKLERAAKAKSGVGKSISFAGGVAGALLGGQRDKK